MLTPHDRVHGQLGAGRPAAQNVPDPRIFVVFEAELGVGLFLLTRLLRRLDGVDRAHCSVVQLKKGRPSVPAPVSASTACSGCGINPTTLPAALLMPAMSRRLPFGLPRA